jgi:hypothetical protein
VNLPLSLCPGLLLALILALPPLTPDQRARLETAFDGRGHEEEAFVALVEAARAAAASGPADLPAPGPSSLIADPDAHRGDAFAVTGVIQQQRPLPRPHDGVHEWFVRLDDGTPVVVFVAGFGVADAARFTDGLRIEIDARFYKRMDEVGRDGIPRTYAAFVGTAPRPAAARGTPGAPVLVILVVVLPLLVVAFIVVRLMARRSAPRSARRRGPAEDPAETDLDESPPLPEDPVAALGELKRRAERS